MVCFLLLFLMTPELSRTQVFPAPYNLKAELSDLLISSVSLEWELDNDSVLYYRIEKNGVFLDNATIKMFNDYELLTDTGTYCYEVFAVYSSGISDPSTPDCIEFYYPHLSIYPDSSKYWMWPNESIVNYTFISNNGPADLNFSFLGFESGVPPGYIVDIDPHSGTVPAFGGHVDIEVRWSSVAYIPGTYSQDLILETNDPTQSYDTLENIMNVYLPACISGFVYDSIMQVPIPGVDVNIGNWKTETNIHGEYFLKVDAGSYNLIFNLQSVPLVIIPVDVAAGDTTYVDAYMQPTNCQSCAVPENIEVKLMNQANGIVEISWDIEESVGYYFSVLKRDGVTIATINYSEPTIYTDSLPEYDNYCYTLSAFYSYGHSGELSEDFEWLPPGVHISVDTLISEVPQGSNTIASFEIFNITSSNLLCTFPDFAGGSFPPGYISSVIPEVTTIPAYEIRNTYVTFNADGYLSGTYYQDLIVETSDTALTIDTIVCCMEVFIPGYLSGAVYSGIWPPHDTIPVFGARVSTGSFATRTLSDGSYYLALPPGEHIIHAGKPGFKSDTDTVIIQEGVSLSYDSYLQRKAKQVPWVTATLDDCADPHNCIVEWGEPIQTSEFIYDDGVADELFVWDDSGNECAIRITPGGYPAQLKGASFYVGDGSYPAANWMGTEFLAIVYDENASGFPGTPLDTVLVEVKKYHWNEFDNLNAEIDSGDFFLSFLQLNPAPNSAPIGVDTTMPMENRSYERNGGAWTISTADWMIRGKLSYPTDSLVIYYTVARTYDFNPEIGPHTGWMVILNNVTGNIYWDSDYIALPVGWYGYGISVAYDDGYIGSWALSNIVGKDFNKHLELYVTDCSGNPIGGAAINMIGQEYPFDTIADSSDASGTCDLECVSMGEYSLYVESIGLQSYVGTIQLWQDTVIEVILDPITFPPQNLWVDTVNITAYWDAHLDTVNVINYSVYLDSLLLGTTDTTFYQFDNLTYGRSYTVCISANYTCVSSDLLCEDFTSGYLVTPEWIEGDSLGSDVLVSWFMDTTGVAGEILGYKLYRDSSFLKYLPYVITEDTCFYMDTSLQPICYEYHVCALYDLTIYGYPGQMKESQYTGPEEVCLVFGTVMPVFEDWSSGNTSGLWTFEDNWDINGQFGDPYPCAEFTWDPVLINYMASLTSGPINGVYKDSTKQEYLDGQFLLAFDIAHEDNGMSGTEFLKVELWREGEWISLAQYNNADGSFDWQNESLDITEYAMGHVFQIRFMAVGENSTAILSWFVDNIDIYHYCAPPLDLFAYGEYFPEILLNWNSPAAPCLGYNVFVSIDNSGYSFIDHVPDTNYSYTYQGGTEISFVVTAMYESCESEHSNQAYLWIGINEFDHSGEIRIFPNPANDEINIESSVSISTLCLLDLSGRKLFCNEKIGVKHFTLDVSSYDLGIYLLRIDTEQGEFVRKVIIAR